MKNNTIAEIEGNFAASRPRYLRFTPKLATLLNELLAAESIEFHVLESRTKELPSLSEKIKRSSKGDLSAITDLSGVRIITYYQDDADTIGRIIEREFLVDAENSVVHPASVEEFGYRSAHYVVSIGATRSKLLEWKGFDGLKAEIQVRTVLQHAWAAISHKLQYKREDDVPMVLRRKLFRLSALFEIADDEFVSLRNTSGNVTTEIETKVSNGDLNLPLDYVSLNTLVNSSPAVAEICAAAEEVGFDFDPVDDASNDGDDRDAISDLIQLATIAGFATVAQFELMLNRATGWAKEYLYVQFNADQNAAPGRWHVSPSFVCELILLRANLKDFRLGDLLKVGYERSIAKRIFESAQKFEVKEDR